MECEGEEKAIGKLAIYLNFAAEKMLYLWKAICATISLRLSFITISLLLSAQVDRSLAVEDEMKAERDLGKEEVLKELSERESVTASIVMEADVFVDQADILEKECEKVQAEMVRLLLICAVNKSAIFALIRYLQSRRS